jgi:RNA polymerase II C-terminal domain phosphatase-like 3/4
MLAVTSQVLQRVHTAVFGAADVLKTRVAPDQQPPWDIRKVVPRLRRSVLRGVQLVFSRVIPLDQPPHTHALWQLAESFGAKCSKQFVPGVTTHVVAREAGTEKVSLARAAGAAVVSQRWLEASCILWQRANEREFGV